MNTIQLQEDITFEEYEMAVRVLGNIGIEVKDSTPQYEVSPTHYDEVFKRRERRINGTDKCSTWEDAKQELLKLV